MWVALRADLWICGSDERGPNIKHHERTKHSQLEVPSVRVPTG